MPAVAGVGAVVAAEHRSAPPGFVRRAASTATTADAIAPTARCGALVAAVAVDLTLVQLVGAGSQRLHKARVGQDGFPCVCVLVGKSACANQHMLIAAYIRLFFEGVEAACMGQWRLVRSNKACAW
jgi:hypothetical protein